MNTTPKLEAPGVIMIDTKHSHNIGGAIRACSCFGVKSLVWTGVRIELDRFARLPREERRLWVKSPKLWREWVNAEDAPEPEQKKRRWLESVFPRLGRKK